MSGKIPITTNKYASVDETVANTDGTKSYPFRLNRLLDSVVNEGPGEAVITLDGGDTISLSVGEYIGPWPDFHCSTITIACSEANQSCRIKAKGV